MSLVNSNKEQPFISGVQVQAIFNEISFSVGDAKTMVMLDESQVMKTSFLTAPGQISSQFTKPPLFQKIGSHAAATRVLKVV